MDRKNLYEMLDIPQEVAAVLNQYEQGRTKELPKEIQDKLFVRSTWEEGVKELQSFLGDDPNGMKALWEQLNLVCDYSYDEYQKRGISEDIFVATMKFCTRFLHEYYATWNTYKYVWTWWFPRQTTLQEFRIGALEYEFVDGDEREIAVHIPSDADMSVASIQNSLHEFYAFRAEFFGDWKNVTLTCDSWMMVPELKELLGNESKIVAFQNLFEIDSVDREATWFMGWIYPGHETVDENLPEKTTLQRELKKYLLSGKKFGIAKGHIIDN